MGASEREDATGKLLFGNNAIPEVCDGLGWRPTPWTRNVAQRERLAADRRSTRNRYNPSLPLQMRAMKLLLESQSGGQYQVAAKGELCQTGREAAEPLRTLLGSLTGRRVTLDLAKVTSFDASGIAWLLNCRRALRQSRGELVVMKAPASLRRALSLLGLPALCPALASAPQRTATKES